MYEQLLSFAVTCSAAGTRTYTDLISRLLESLLSLIHQIRLHFSVSIVIHICTNAGELHRGFLKIQMNSRGSDSSCPECSTQQLELELVYLFFFLNLLPKLLLIRKCTHCTKTSHASGPLVVIGSSSVAVTRHLTFWTELKNIPGKCLSLPHIIDSPSFPITLTGTPPPSFISVQLLCELCEEDFVLVFKDCCLLDRHIERTGEDFSQCEY